MEWIFDGIGTELLSLIIGAIVGGTVGYKIGSKNKQIEKKSNNSKQIQNAINVGGNISPVKNVKIGDIKDEQK